ncbi:GGDEF domain-containing protein [Gracilibacillus caseinilyticus]|uniref:GGDEF domain-containing protein n=1 Tax=Gracilibacillus caseinilyticus TaxID=2932256 RepID=A0ABY4EWK1_9BACI|nr:GGDEF domain-containing protein [Gracilibacillus caseinilyticus]UOQ48645.1 GGDEF domain-containing protein [Gracilibacillus caseinilyticus]
MDYLVQFQINVFAIMILIVLYVIIKMKSKVKSFGKKILKVLMVATALAIIVEPLTWIFDGMHFFGAYFWGYATNFMLFMIGPVIGGIILSYVDYHLFKEPGRLYKRRFYQDFSVLTFIVLLINIFYPVYFYITPDDNSFHSGDFKWVHYLILVSLYVYMFVFVIINRKRTQKYVMNIFLVFFMLPIIGMVIQLFESKLHFSWTSIVLGILVAYIFLETSSTEEDYLTKLYNRQSYEIYLQHLVEGRKPFGVLLMDLNEFKEINDYFGHDKGDQVLVSFAEVLKKVFHTNALVSRLGGDEFIVVLEANDRDIKKCMKEIDHLLAKNPDTFIQNLRYSYGYQKFSSQMSVDELYTLVDKKMYQDKKR